MFAALGNTRTSDFVNSKVHKFIALAPIVYLASVESFVVRSMLSNFGEYFINITEKLGIH